MQASGHVALLGDSIFDNAAYTRGEPDVVGHLRGLLPAGWRATLLAVDGATTGDIVRQLPRVARDVTQLVVSVGGNDAILSGDLLAAPVSSTAQALMLFGERLARFESAYRPAIDAVLALRRETTSCTIYNGNLDRDEAPLARVALMMFNDVILRVAFEHRLGVIDLRSICASPEDYANPIEPSGRGGRRIAEAIVRSLGLGGPAVEPSRVWGGAQGATGSSGGTGTGGAR
jgi:hypothetical protein